MGEDLGDRMQTNDQVAATLAGVPNSDAVAVADELYDRIKASEFRTVDAYCAATGEDKRNLTRYFRQKREVRLSVLTRHLQHLGITHGEFFEGVTRRLGE